MRKYLQLFRVWHYIKNLLVFLPMFFGGVIFDKHRIINACLGFIAFSMLSSAVYVINDCNDIEKDRQHPVKKNRPLAKGEISRKVAILSAAALFAGTLLCSVLIGDKVAFLCLLIYLILNVAYSLGLKSMPIIDVVILASGFVIRVFYGGIITGVPISKWLYLVVVTGSLYMGLGKRRNELRVQTDTREVLKYYNENFLDKNMYVCVALMDVFYALWSIEMPNPRIIWTVPFFIILIMYYSLNIEGESGGDPVEVIIHDKSLIGIIIAYVLCLFLLLYVF